MYRHIEDNIYTIPVPLPDNPLRELNAYVIKSDGQGKNLLIDTGFRLRKCRDALCAGLDELGVSMDDTDIFLTHLHSDHTGLAGDFAGKNTEIFIGAEDGRRLIDNLSRTDPEDLIRPYRTYGFSEAELGQLIDLPIVGHRSNPFTPTLLQNGDRLKYGGHRFETILTPGHTPGHMCLYDAESRIMFLGDHVLFDITPNITTWPGFSDPLGCYVRSLLDIGCYDVRLPLPSHRSVSCPMSDRIGEIIEHHGSRVRETLDVLDICPGGSIYEIASRMSWRVHGSRPGWANVPLTQKWFAAGETDAHLEYLLDRGRVEREIVGGVWKYRRR